MINVVLMYRFMLVFLWVLLMVGFLVCQVLLCYLWVVDFVFDYDYDELEMLDVEFCYEFYCEQNSLFYEVFGKWY